MFRPVSFRFVLGSVMEVFVKLLGLEATGP
jgi:hypothetical protein